MYGYNVENKKYVINEEESAIVRQVFENYANGMKAQEIVDELNNKGLKTKYFKTRKRIKCQPSITHEHTNQFRQPAVRSFIRRYRESIYHRHQYKRSKVKQYYQCS